VITGSSNAPSLLVSTVRKWWGVVAVGARSWTAATALAPSFCEIITRNLSGRIHVHGRGPSPSSGRAKLPLPVSSPYQGHLLLLPKCMIFTAHEALHNLNLGPWTAVWPMLYPSEGGESLFDHRLRSLLRSEYGDVASMASTMESFEVYDSELSPSDSSPWCSSSA